MRVGALLFLLVALVPARAAPGYEDALAEAERVLHSREPGESEDAPLDRAYRQLERAVRLAPGRWEAYALRGMNRCDKAVLVRRLLGEHLTRLRAQGATRSELAAQQARGEELIELCLKDAWSNFELMRQAMARAGSSDPELLRFAEALMKFGAGQFLEARDGEPGAIEDFRALLERGWREEVCAEKIARGYLELGLAAFLREDYPEAHSWWDRGLEYARAPGTRRSILSNKAAVYQYDNEYGRAEEILRRQAAAEPGRPVHWKNLGLVLGYQNRLREALWAYRRAREACAATPEAGFTGLYHGNAWLKPAVIHGKLLEGTGDLRLAWRLFLEYRDLLGDDYNFCFNFGDFLESCGGEFRDDERDLAAAVYDLAYTYVKRARDLQPFCHQPYQMLLRIAQRTSGTAEEIDRRVAEARRAFEEARTRFHAGEESPEVRRVCGGVRDLADGDPPAGSGTRMEPDPLAGFDAATPPAWLGGLASRRDAFEPWDPAEEEANAGPRDAPAPPGPEPAPSAALPPGLLVAAGAAVAVLLAAGIAIARRRRR